MRSRTRSWGAVAALALSALVGVTACAGSRGAERATATPGARHPDVDTGLDTCFGCHAKVTPQVAVQWRDGRHGVDLVDCVVCHGSTGADFKAKPGVGGCAGCHAAQLKAISGGDGTKSCFGCHTPHALHAEGTMPHPSKPQEAAR